MSTFKLQLSNFNLNSQTYTKITFVNSMRENGAKARLIIALQQAWSTSQHFHVQVCLRR